MTLSEAELEWIKMHTNFEQPKEPTSGFINIFEHCSAVEVLNSLMNSLIPYYTVNKYNKDQTLEYRNRCAVRLKEVQAVNCHPKIWKDVNAMKRAIAKYDTLFKHLQSLDATRNN
jgi:hypothetical protein